MIVDMFMCISSKSEVLDFW